MTQWYLDNRRRLGELGLSAEGAPGSAGVSAECLGLSAED